MRNESDHTTSSGNVFADLGVEAPEEEALAKAELTARIASIIEARESTQSAAARVIGIDQPGVSALLQGKLTSFPTERLIGLVNGLASASEGAPSGPSGGTLDANSGQVSVERTELVGGVSELVGLVSAIADGLTSLEKRVSALERSTGPHGTAVTVIEAARLLGASRTQVFHLLATKQLQRARSVGQRTMVMRTSIDELLATPRRRRRRATT